MNQGTEKAAIAHATLEDYRALAGILALPELIPGELSLRHHQCNADTLPGQLAQWQQAEGWFLLADGLHIGPPPEQTASRLLEGQWYDRQREQSLHLVFGQPHYRLTFFHLASAGSSTAQACYRDQAIFLRPALRHAERGEAMYRLWWQLSSQGSWQPQAQQFIGFSHANAHDTEAPV
ncbi:hypothetical protein KSI86_16425 [Dickeya oryzae]|uniref:hypothetical protein n=1 Tax=Dickeya oryzae TaxID=1240404 RepID=UPI0020976377|nr:hypothetical protein [Dickeya oryzae]MCO7255746.1 hypothetical protein [Dickeya oryzae]